jgi:hypothetical protein
MWLYRIDRPGNINQPCRPRSHICKVSAHPPIGLALGPAKIAVAPGSACTCNRLKPRDKLLDRLLHISITDLVGHEYSDILEI